MTVTDAYRSDVLKAYEGELRGEAYFNAMARHFDEPGAAGKLAMLGEIERRTALALLPLLARYGLAPGDGATARAGAARLVAERAGKTWTQLVAQMVELYPSSLDRIAAMEAAAPGDDLPAWRVFSEHARVIVDFAYREHAGEADSTASLAAFLAAHKG
jgi:hypothetical protein